MNRFRRRKLSFHLSVFICYSLLQVNAITATVVTSKDPSSVALVSGRKLRRDSKALLSKQRRMNEEVHSVTTSFDGTLSNNGNMFDVITYSNSIFVHQIDLHTASNADVTYEIWMRNGTHVSYELSSSGWYMISCGDVQGLGVSMPTPLLLNSAIGLPANSIMGLYVTFVRSGSNTDGYVLYSAGEGVGTLFVNDANLGIFHGSSITYPFLAYFPDRLWNGSLYYTIIQNSDEVQNINTAMVACFSPTVHPSLAPTVHPSMYPTDNPSFLPSLRTSLQPSSVTTFSPSSLPTMSISVEPSLSESKYPTMYPNIESLPNPSMRPLFHPSVKPSPFISMEPSIKPSFFSTFIPSIHLSIDPTVFPSLEPLQIPSLQPSFDLTKIPSLQPSLTQSNTPSSNVSSKPSINLSLQPSLKPSSSPSLIPSVKPSSSPSLIPSVKPSSSPSLQPSVNPSFNPSLIPSLKPSFNPSLIPSSKPSSNPSLKTSLKKRIGPSLQPSLHPTKFNSNPPTYQPLSDESLFPSTQPTLITTQTPSEAVEIIVERSKTEFPSFSPSTTPSVIPTQLQSNLIHAQTLAGLGAAASAAAASSSSAAASSSSAATPSSDDLFKNQEDNLECEGDYENERQSDKAQCDIVQEVLDIYIDDIGMEELTCDFILANSSSNIFMVMNDKNGRPRMREEFCEKSSLENEADDHCYEICA